jgi:hypothetical protein
MNPLALAKLIESAKVRDWHWSRPHEPGAPCLTGSCGLRGISHCRVSFTFTEGHTTHKLQAERSLSDNAATVTLDGEVLAGTMRIRKHWKGLLPPRVWLEVRVVAPGVDLRFDGRLSGKL